MRIADLFQALVCAINRARWGSARQISYHVIQIPRGTTNKRYTAIAQATLITERRNEPFRLVHGLSDSDLYDTLASLVEGKSGHQDSLDALSDRFRTHLREAWVVGLPEIFFPLQHYHSHAEQDEIATLNLSHLKDEGTILEIGDSDEERLQSSAQLCGRLCFWGGFELPPNLSDATLPDLLAKLSIMKLGHGLAVDGWRHTFS